MYVGLRAQDLDSMHRASMFDPSSAGGTDEGSLAHESMRFYAKLTFSAVYLGITYYSWVEQQRVVDAGGGVPGFVDLPGGRFGSVPGDPTGATAFSNPATEPNNAAPIPPVIVRIGKSYFDPALGTVYIATIASATFGLEVKDSSGAPDLTNITELITDHSTLVLTGPSAGVAKIAAIQSPLGGVELAGSNALDVYGGAEKSIKFGTSAWTIINNDSGAFLSGTNGTVVNVPPTLGSQSAVYIIVANFKFTNGGGPDWATIRINTLSILNYGVASFYLPPGSPFWGLQCTGVVAVIPSGSLSFNVLLASGGTSLQFAVGDSSLWVHRIA